MKNDVQRGDNIDVVLTATKLSGQGNLTGANLFGIMFANGVSGETRAVGIEGVYSVAKLTTDVMVVGAKVNWNNANTEVQLATSTLDGVGTVIEDAGNGILEVKIKLTPQ